MTTIRNCSIHSTYAGRSILVGDSDDDGEPNTYDYNDSFIDDPGESIFQVPA